MHQGWSLTRELTVIPFLKLNVMTVTSVCQLKVVFPGKKFEMTANSTHKGFSQKGVQMSQASCGHSLF